MMTRWFYTYRQAQSLLHFTKKLVKMQNSIAIPSTNLHSTYIYVPTTICEKYECVVRWKRCKLMIGETASKVLTASLQRRTIALSCQDGNSRCRAQINEPIAIRGPLLFVSRWAGHYIHNVMVQSVHSTTLAYNSILSCNTWYTALSLVLFV